MVLGTRGSLLARTQSEWVADKLRACGHEVELRTIVTRGDREQSRPIPELGGKGLFTAELEAALRDGSIHLAVHSLKDLPVEDADGIVVAAIPEREMWQDALVTPGALELADLPPKHMPDLAEGGRGAEHDGWVVGVEKPEDGHAGAEALAQAVARFNGHSLIVRQRRQHLALLVPQVDPQQVAGKLFG